MRSEFLLRAGVVLAIALSSAACSTQRHDGTTVSSTVELNIRTTPEGGRCVLERNGQRIAVIEKAPQTVTFDRSAREITVSCELERHISTVEVVRSTYVGGPLKTAPSPLASLVAAALVTASPANYEYQSHVHVRFDSNVFPDVAARDAKYEELRGIIAKRHENRLDKIKNECPNAEVCRTSQQAADAQRNAEIAELESFKAKAEIVPPAAAPKAQAKPAAKKAG
jgi:hypothetical protein